MDEKVKGSELMHEVQVEKRNVIFFLYRDVLVFAP